MALQKRSRLHKLLLTFDDDGKYVDGEALFEEGAWNTETENWEGSPHKTEYPLTNMDPAGKKFLNDVIGVAATKALETAAVAAETLKASAAREKAVHDELVKAKIDLGDALGARDNFAALEKKARGDLITCIAKHDEAVSLCWKESLKLGKIPRWTRRLFGAL